MRFQKYIKERSYGEERGKTTKNHGHDHDYFIDRMSGNGTTSDDKGHYHKIRAMVVLPVDNYKDDHKHELRTGK